MTQRVGALDDRYLARDRPLGEARVLWEIGDDGAEVRALRARLGLDSGYLSRLLRTLEAAGLVSVEPGAATGACAPARPTAAGRAERELLDRRSDELAASTARAAERRAAERLVAAMGEVERLLTAALVEIAAADPAAPRRAPLPRRLLRRARPALRRRLRPAPGARPSRTSCARRGGLLLLATSARCPSAAGR